MLKRRTRENISRKEQLTISFDRKRKRLRPIFVDSTVLSSKISHQNPGESALISHIHMIAPIPHNNIP